MEDQVYLLTNYEFMILAANAGIRTLYGFDMQPDETEREEAIYAMQELNRKEYLSSEKMAYIFDQIRNAQTTMEIRKESGRKCLLYINDSVIRVSHSLRRKEMYELSEIPFDRTWEYLQEEGWLLRPQDEGETL